MKAKKTQLEILNAIYDQDLECHIRSYRFQRVGLPHWKILHS